MSFEAAKRAWIDAQGRVDAALKSMKRELGALPPAHEDFVRLHELRGEELQRFLEMVDAAEGRATHRHGGNTSIGQHEPSTPPNIAVPHRQSESGSGKEAQDG